MFKDTKAFSGFSVDDIEAARTFYGEMLGIDVQDGEMGLLHLNLAGGSRPTLIYPKPDHEPAAFTILNFPVTDIESATQQLRDRGVKFERYPDSPMEIGEDGIFRGGGPLIAWFKDPAGNVLSVIEADGPQAT